MGTLEMTSSSKYVYVRPFLSLVVALSAYFIAVGWKGGDLSFLAMRWKSLMRVPTVGITVSPSPNDPHRRDEQVAPDTTLPNTCLQEHPRLQDMLSQFTVRLHHNGNPEPCATMNQSSAPHMAEAFTDALQALHLTSCPKDKFQMETFLTLWMQRLLETPHGTQQHACGPAPEKSWVQHCDAGTQHTVVQLDHNQLIPVRSDANTSTLPCRFFTREGLRVKSIDELQQLLQSQQCQIQPDQDHDHNHDHEHNHNNCHIDIYAAPAGRVFMFAPSHVGEMFHLDHVRDSQGQPLALQVLSLQPRVFDVYNFFSKDESQQLIDKALAETKEEYKLSRSTTGTVGKHVFNKRTSENAWDTMGTLAQKIKRRSFAALGLDEYHEGMSDGLQILRYNLTTAYVPHMDVLEDFPGEDYNYDPSTWGGNRFATILLYMSDLPENGGGETVFVDGWPSDLHQDQRLTDEQSLQQLRASGDAQDLRPGSWEETMVAQCRSRLAVRPNASRAVLFYSQFPDGRIDNASKHGGCPVLKGTKWAANLWVWNAPRPEFPGRPLKAGRSEQEDVGEYQQVRAVFRNSGQNPAYDHAELYFEGKQFFGKLGPNDPPLPMNTYRTHEWHIMADGKLLKTIVIDGKKEHEEFVF